MQPLEVLLSGFRKADVRNFRRGRERVVFAKLETKTAQGFSGHRDASGVIPAGLDQLSCDSEM
jgi:hypothetical protein